MSKLPKQINFQNQPTNATCMHTCIAMIADKPVAEVIETANKLFVPEQMEAGQALNDLLGYKLLVHYGFLPLQQQFPVLYGDNLYLVAAPSLNFKGHMHAVLIDMRDGNHFVYDPQNGRGDFEYYTVDNLESWAVATRILEI